AVALVGDLLVVDPGKLPRPLLDGAIDVVGGHVDRLGARDRRPEARVGVGIPATVSRRDRDLLDVLGEDLPALGVGRALLALDRAPLRMAGHAEPRPPLSARGAIREYVGWSGSTDDDHAPGG